MSYVIVGLFLLIAIGFAAEDVARHIDAIEAWITDLGPWSILVFVGLYVIATTLLLPESVLSIVGGALFGLTWGLAAVVVGSVLAASLQYALAQRLLRNFIRDTFAARPSLAAIQRAVTRDEVKLQVLLRLTPLNPATLSYILGAAGVKFAGFLAASLAGFPHLLLEVYFGFAGKHVAGIAGQSTEVGSLHDVIVIGGLAVTLIVLVFVSRIAHKALIEAMPATVATGRDTAR